MRIRVLTALATLLAATTSHAESTAQERMEKTFALIKQHADTYYPAIARASRLPDGVVIGLIVTRELEVVDHSVAFDFPEGTTTTDELRHMFPNRRLADRTGGGGCFGGTKQGEPKYCVVFGELEK